MKLILKHPVVILAVLYAGFCFYLWKEVLANTIPGFGQGHAEGLVWTGFFLTLVLMAASYLNGYVVGKQHTENPVEKRSGD